MSSTAHTKLSVGIQMHQYARLQRHQVIQMEIQSKNTSSAILESSTTYSGISCEWGTPFEMTTTCLSHNSLLIHGLASLEPTTRTRTQPSSKQEGTKIQLCT